MHILLNASNLGATGPEVVVRDLVGAMLRDDARHRFTLLLPSTHREVDWLPKGAGIQVLFERRTRPYEVGRMWDIHFGIRKICSNIHADVCLTLGDVGPVDAGVPHVLFLHQPYLAYPEQDAMSALPLGVQAKQIYLRQHFRRSARQARSVIVQTPVMAERVTRIYGLSPERIHIIPPALPEHVLRWGTGGNGGSKGPEGTPQLLFLSTYYAHKNHAILPPLCEELRRRGLSGKVGILLTLDGDRRAAEAKLLCRLARYPDLVSNLGRLKPMDVAPTLQSASTLFLPTLLETVGLIYLEAFALGTPVLTSDRDFARWMCRDLAGYFEPTDAASVADAIEAFLKNGPQHDYRARAAERKNEFPSGWPEVARSFLSVVEQAAA